MPRGLPDRGLRSPPWQNYGPSGGEAGERPVTLPLLAASTDTMMPNTRSAPIAVNAIARKAGDRTQRDASTIWPGGSDLRATMGGASSAVANATPSSTPSSMASGAGRGLDQGSGRQRPGSARGDRPGRGKHADPSGRASHRLVSIRALPRPARLS